MASGHGCFETGFGPCESWVVEVHHPYAEHHSPWLETSPTRESSSLWRRFLFFDETGGFQSRGIFVALNTSPQKISGPLRRNHVKRRSSSDSSRFAFLFSLRACSTWLIRSSVFRHTHEFCGIFDLLGQISCRWCKHTSVENNKESLKCGPCTC